MDGNENNDDKIFIPYGIKIEKEIFTGFGKKELKHLIISVLITAALSLILYLITQNPLMVVVTAVMGLLLSFWICSKQPYSQSVIEILKSIITYCRTQQKFEYIYHNNLMKNLTETQENGTSSPISENNIGGENAEHNDNTGGGNGSRGAC